MHDHIRKTVIVTGGNRGIGQGIVEYYAKHGWHVVVGARKVNENMLTQYPDGIEFVSFDAQKQSDHHALVDQALKTTGRLDVYINNAGYSAWKPIEAIDDPFLDDMLATNLKGVFWGCQAAAKAMSDGGSIINISSIAGKRGSKNNSAYCATKFGVNGMTQALAKELGEKGIRVNALCPVLIITDGLIDALTEEYAPCHESDPHAFIEQFASQQSALLRLPTSEEVASTCMFLSSDVASAITGQCMNVDCGVLPQ